PSVLLQALLEMRPPQAAVRMIGVHIARGFSTMSGAREQSAVSPGREPQSPGSRGREPKERGPLELRPISLELGVNRYAEGSVLIRAGHTHVLCAATVEPGVPKWLEGKGKGWVT